MYGSIVYGAQYLFTSDQLAKRLFTSAPGPVGKTLGKLVGAVLMSHAAVIYQIKNILKASDTEIARLNIFLSTAYLLTALWAHAKGYLKAYDSTIASVLCFVLNAFVGYA